MSTQHSTRNRAAPSLACLFILVSIVGTFIAPSTALAHKVNVFAYVEGGEVITESYFNDGRKCRDSTIEVFDTQGNKLAEGKTDAEGRFSFRPSIRTDLLIRLTASMGHQAEYTIPAADLPASLPTATEGVEGIAEEPHEHKHPEPTESVSADSPDRQSFDPAEIERIIDRSVARQLAPIHRALEESGRQRGISDVIGGVGYIVGLMGLVMYFRSKRKQGQ